ncbi:MAG: hypothetical protein J7K40_11470 [candidate division Zixibacteria bacterium]|nr:hypothetical protein [candidate division Zixibacteria bacterium]
MPAKIIFTPDQEQDIIRLYHKHRSGRKTARAAGYDRHTIQKVLDKYNIERYPTNSNKLPVDHDYFKELTPGSSYFLGLWIADGSFSFSKNGSGYFSISLKKEDRGILELLRKELKSEHKIINDRHLYKYSVGDNRLLLNIVKWGIEWEDKSHRLSDCSYLFNELDKTNTTHHFIRGVFDGDGGVSMPKYYYNTMVYFTGTKAFISKLQNVINAHCETKGYLQRDRQYKHVDGFYYALKYTGRQVSIKILDWLYQDKGEYYLKRKYNIYSRLLDQFSNK